MKRLSRKRNYESDKEVSSVFNHYIDKDKLNNVTEIVIDIFNVFEQNCIPEKIAHLKELKNTIVTRIYISFLNQEFVKNFHLLEGIKSNNLYSSSYTISNLIAFDCSFHYLKLLNEIFKKNISNFIHIAKKERDIKLDGNKVLLIFLMCIKYLLVKFKEFYEYEIGKLSSKEKNVNID